jgi:hypothetical protein
LERQKQALELFCSKNGWSFDIIACLGSGMNYHKKGLKKLLGAVDDSVGRLALTREDRLLRFGAESAFAICEAEDVEAVIVNKGEAATFEEDSAADALEMAAAFSARLHGSRSKKNKRLLDGAAKVVGEAPNDEGAQNSTLPMQRAGGLFRQSLRRCEICAQLGACWMEVRMRRGRTGEWGNFAERVERIQERAVSADA